MSYLKRLNDWAKAFPNFPSRLAVQNKIAELLTEEENQPTAPCEVGDGSCPHEKDGTTKCKSCQPGDPDKWLIITKRHQSIYKGTVLFWGADSQGYTSDVRRAGRYTGTEARRWKEQSHGEDFGIRETDALAIRSMLCIDVGEVENYFRKKG